MGIKHSIYVAWRWFNKIFEFLTPFGDLFIRFWLAKVFFLSGLTKIQTWQSTVFLFTHEYAVPVLPPQWAAVSGTATELMIPVFLLLGLGGRLPAFILFVFNLVAVYSYPFLFTQAGAKGLEDHFYWGILIMVILLHGVGKLSIDHLIARFRRAS